MAGLWIKVDTGFYREAQLVLAGPMAKYLHVVALCFCRENMTDGILLKEDVMNKPAIRRVTLAAVAMNSWWAYAMWPDLGNGILIGPAIIPTAVLLMMGLYWLIED